MNAFYDCSMRMSGCVEPGRSCAVAAPTGPLPREANVHAAKTKPKADCLTVFCPSTQCSIRTTIATDVRTLTKAWHSKIKVSCPHCSGFTITECAKRT